MRLMAYLYVSAHSCAGSDEASRNHGSHTSHHRSDGDEGRRKGRNGAGAYDLRDLRAGMPYIETSIEGAGNRVEKLSVMEGLRLPEARHHLRFQHVLGHTHRHLGQGYQRAGDVWNRRRHRRGNRGE